MIDIIVFNEAMARHHPRFRGRGEGILAVIEPQDLVDPDGITGQTVTVERPNGTRTELRVHLAEAPAGTLGLFFRGITPADVPAGSSIEWQNAS